MDLIGKLGSFWESSKRIFAVSKKPDWKEYSTLVKVTGLGIVLIALIGYIIFLIFTMTGLGT